MIVWLSLLLGTELCPHSLQVYVEVLMPNMTIFENGAVRDIIKVNGVIRVAPEKTDVLV